jgi:hypothetical protein
VFSSDADSNLNDIIDKLVMVTSERSGPQIPAPIAPKKYMYAEYEEVPSQGYPENPKPEVSQNDYRKPPVFGDIKDQQPQPRVLQAKVQQETNPAIRSV